MRFPRHIRSSALLLLLSDIFILNTRAIWPFPSKRFSANAFVDAQGLGLEDAGRIIAFGDFDGDQLLVDFHPLCHIKANEDSSSLDVITLAEPADPSSDQTILQLYTWSHSNFQFSKNATIQSPNSRPIVNVVPGDFTHDGKLDLLLMTSAGSKLEMWLVIGDAARGFGMSAFAL
jgi:integrin alpha FG-GAP repeat containing protein 1